MLLVDTLISLTTEMKKHFKIKLSILLILVENTISIHLLYCTKIVKIQQLAFAFEPLNKLKHTFT